MTPSEAVAAARELQDNNPNCSDEALQKYARTVLEDGSEHDALNWVAYVETHLEQMAQKIVESRNVGVIVDLFYLCIWESGIDDSSNLAINIREAIVELDAVAEFVHLVDFHHRAYSLEDFYCGLPPESRVGVLV